jgi:predicted nucleotidyltransferase
MAKLLPDDFKDFLKLCNRKKVKYLLIGGYAVGYHGYPRTTADMDVWIELSSENAARMVEVLSEFGFRVPELTVELFLERGKIVRLGVPPLRLEILNEITGVTFEECYSQRERTKLDGIKVNIISLKDLIRNKKASGRPKDLDDLEHLG